MNHPNVAWLNDNNKHHLQQPINANGLYFSHLRQAEGSGAFRNVSIKYVLEGCEYYRIEGKEYKVEAGNFLLANQRFEGEVYFQSKNPVLGICIDLHPALLRQAMQAIARKNQQDPDRILAQEDDDLLVLEQLYNARHTPLHHKLWEVAQMDQSTAAAISEEWFMELAELIAIQEQTHNQALQAMEMVKRSTQEEIYRRLLQGKTYMDEHFVENPPIAEIARHCFMSEFYFFRCFKQAFGTTPHRYMMNKRLDLAAKLMRQQQVGISQVAIATGFADLSTFSRTFKKYYNMTPTQYVASI